MNRKYIFLALVAAFLFSLSTPFSKILLENLHPILLASLLYLGAAIFLLPISIKEFPREIYIIRCGKDMRRLLGAAVFGGIIGPLCLLYGIKQINASSASLLLNFETVATTFVAWFLFKEHISKKIVFSSILMCVAGAFLVVNMDLSINWGGLLIVAACCSWALDNNFTAAVESISPSTNTIIKGVFAGLFNLLLFFAIEELNFLLKDVLFALLLGGFAYGLSIWLYIRSARHMGAARSQIIFAANPFLGVIVSYFVLTEKLGLGFCIGLALMLVSIVLVYFERHHHHHIHKEIEHEHEHSHHDGHHDHTHLNEDCKNMHTHKHQHGRCEHAHVHFPDVHHKHSH